MTGAAPGARVPHPGGRIEINADDYEIVACPDCGRPAFVEWRTHIESTNGAVEHLKILCLDRHWFFLPVSSVVRPEAHPAADSSQPPTPHAHSPGQGARAGVSEAGLEPGSDVRREPRPGE